MNVGLSLLDPAFMSKKRSILTSDSFTGGNTASIAGRVTDCALGGTPLTWVYAPAGGSAAAISSGGLTVASSASKRVCVDPGVGDVAVMFKMPAIRTGGGTVRIMARHPADGSNNYYGINLGAGTYTVQKIVAGVSTIFGGGVSGVVADGDDLGIITLGNRLAVIRNGIITLAFTDTDLNNTNTRVGIATGNAVAVTGLILDDFRVYNLAA